MDLWPEEVQEEGELLLRQPQQLPRPAGLSLQLVGAPSLVAQPLSLDHPLPVERVLLPSLVSVAPSCVQLPARGDPPL